VAGHDEAQANETLSRNTNAYTNMFKKKPTVKPLAPLRSSDRRKTADSIIAEYGLQPKAQDDTNIDDKAAATAETTALRNALLPDGVQTARFTTTHGPDLKQVSGTVYVGAYPGDDARVLWFKIEDRMYPTVYTLWKQPGIVPLLHTPGFVVQKLQGGADLMTPGLANGPPFDPRATKGAVVAIASLEQPSVPVAVGACLIDVSSLGAVQGSRGHAVQNMHWAGDEIWSYSNSNKPGISPPESIHGWLSSKDDEEKLAEQAADLDIDDDEEEQGGVNLGESPSEQPDPSEGLGEDAPTDEGLVEKVDIKEMTTKGIFSSLQSNSTHADNNQKSMTPSAKPSSTVLITTRRPTLINQTLVSSTL
jgi:translation initiation factor 2D